MILLKILREYQGHRVGTFQYFPEETADLLIKEGIAEAAHKGQKPELPFNFRHWLQPRR